MALRQPGGPVAEQLHALLGRECGPGFRDNPEGLSLALHTVADMGAGTQERSGDMEFSPVVAFKDCRRGLAFI